MTKQEHATKLRLIADIVENDLPFEISENGKPFRAPSMIHAGHYSDMASCSIRIKPEPAPPVLIPLGPDDVPIGSSLRHAGSNEWHVITTRGTERLYFGGVSKGFEDLKRYYEIKLPGEDWQPCHKVQA